MIIFPLISIEIRFVSIREKKKILFFCWNKLFD